MIAGRKQSLVLKMARPQYFPLFTSPPPFNSSSLYTSPFLLPLLNTSPIHTLKKVFLCFNQQCNFDPLCIIRT